MNSTNEIVKKYFEQNPEIADLARKFSLKEEFIKVDVFGSEGEDDRLILNDECLEKFKEVYGPSLSEAAQQLLLKRKENGKSIELSAALAWMNNHYKDALVNCEEEIVKYCETAINSCIKKGKADKFDYTNLPNIIIKAIGYYTFATASIINIEEVKHFANIIKNRNDKIVWDDEVYSVYSSLIQLSSNLSVNTGLEDCIKNTSVDILEVLKLLKYLKDEYKNIDFVRLNKIKDKLLNDKINNPSTYIADLYERLLNENKLYEVLSSSKKYLFVDELNEYIKSLQSTENTGLDLKVLTDTDTVGTYSIDTTFDYYDGNIIDVDYKSLVDERIVKDVETCLAKYKNDDTSNIVVRITMLKDIVDTLFSLDKDLYNINSILYNQESVVSSIHFVMQKNSIDISEEQIEYEVNDAKNRIKPITYDLDISDLSSYNSIKTNPEILKDLEDILCDESLNNYDKEEVKNNDELKYNLLVMVLSKLLSTKKSIYDPNSVDYDNESLIGSIYTKLEEYGISYDYVCKFINDIIPTDIDENINSNSNIIYKIFNELPEKDVKDNLTKVYEADNKLDKDILDEFSKFINASMYGSVRDIATIESQFTSFCGSNGINYSDDFIDSLPDIMRDKYKNPVVKKEIPEKVKGETFKILKRYIPKTSIKTKKKIYASIAGVGIISFLFMTVVKVLSPDNAAESCTETFEKLLQNEMLAQIFGDVKTYFASMAVSVLGTSGLIYTDENEKSKSK